MKSLLYILLASLILSGCSMGSGSTTRKVKSEEVIREEYEQLQAEIDDIITIKDGEVIYDYEAIKVLVYDFDVLSANMHLDGEWTHETLLEEMIQNIEEITKKP